MPLHPGPLPGRVLTRISRRLQRWRRGHPRRPEKGKTREGMLLTGPRREEVHTSERYQVTHWS
eukprot:6989184-Pyramimonas_sp.AAC.1